MILNRLYRLANNDGDYELVISNEHTSTDHFLVFDIDKRRYIIEQKYYTGDSPVSDLGFLEPDEINRFHQVILYRVPDNTNYDFSGGVAKDSYLDYVTDLIKTEETAYVIYIKRESIDIALDDGEEIRFVAYDLKI